MTKENNKTYFVLIIGILLWPITLLSQDLRLSETDEIVLLNEGIQLSNDARFDPYQSNSVADWELYNPEQEYIHQGVFWIKIDIDSEVEKEALLYLDILQEVQIYIKYRDSITYASYTGVLVPLDERSAPDGLIVPKIGNSAQEIIPLQLGLQSIYLRVNNSFEHPFVSNLKLYDLYLWNQSVKVQRESNFLVQGIFGGALLLISIYHLLIFFGRRDTAYFWYAAYTLTMFYALWIETGITQTFLFRNNQFFHHYIEMTQMYSMLASLFYFMFMRSFIQLDQLVPKLDKLIVMYLKIMIPISIAMDIGYFTDLQRTWLFFGYIPSISTLTLGFVTVFIVFRTGDKLAYYFVVGTLILYTFVMSNTIISILEFNDIIPLVDFDRTYLTEIGVMIEIIIFSLGLGYRMRVQQREKRRIEDLDEMKSKFFTNISHEFRTPLTIISGMTDQITGHTKEKELIQRNSKNLLQLVNQLLDLSQLESNTMAIKKIQADIIPFLQYLTESFFSMAREKDIRLTFYPEIEKQVMDFDENKVQQLIYNLLINAIKYTDSGGKVILHVNVSNVDQQQYLSIKVKDTGHGISKNDIPYIFDRFYQTESSAQSPTPGTGVGLALTKEIVNLLDGDISVQSTIGEGSEFKVILPIQTKAPQGQPSLDRLYVPIDNHDQIADFVADDLPILLLVEDNADIITYISGILKSSYSVHIAKNGEQGIAKALDLIPDIIISDVMMPIKDGYELCATLKTDVRTSHIPIILLTAKNTDPDKVSGIEHGADAYLTKPFNKAELFSRIRNLLANRKRLQAHYSNWESRDKDKEETSTIDDPFFETIMEVINTKMDNSKLGVNDLCAAVHLSRMQVNRKVKALTGMTPGAYINHIRLEQAQQLLNSTDQTIAEIAYDCGFSDPNYFSRAYSKAYGHPPSRARAEK